MNTTTMMNNSSCWDRPEWRGGVEDQVERNFDGSARKPIMMNPGLFLVHCICCSVGLPANIQTIFEVVGNAEINRKPRNVFQLSTVVSSIFILLEAIVEMGYHLSPSNEQQNKTMTKGTTASEDGQQQLMCEDSSIVCLVHTAISGLPYVLFLFNLFFALIDCLLRLTFPVWYCNPLTYSSDNAVWHIVAWLSTLNLTLALSVKWVFISGTAPLRCAIQTTQSQTLNWTLIILFSACLFVYAINLLVKVTRFDQRRRQSYRITPHHQQLQHQHDEPAVPSTAEMSLNIDLEMEAAKSLLITVAPLLILFFPWLNYITVCHHLMDYWLPPWSVREGCEASQWIEPYLEELVLIVLGVCYPVLVNSCRIGQSFEQTTRAIDTPTLHRRSSPATTTSTIHQSRF